MTTQAARARAFHALHRPGDPLVLFNIWDAGSARAVAKAGAKAIATGSWSVAAAAGYDDAEAIPLDEAIGNLRRIVGAVDLPVTLDLESGYGPEPATVGASFARALEAGAVGCNLEDQIIGGQGLYGIAEQAERLAAARAAAERGGVPAFINARTDLFLKAPADQHDDALVRQAIERGRAYAGAGASGLFAPGLGDERLIGMLCAQSPLPVNVMAFPGAPGTARLAELGVARVSYGPGPYRQMMAALQAAARAAFG